MSGSTPAPRPPPRGSYSLAAGAGAGGAAPAPAPVAAAEEKEAEGTAEAPAETAGPAATGTFVARVAASPGVNVDVEVRIKTTSGKLVEGVITGRRSRDSSYPVAPLGLDCCLQHGLHPTRSQPEGSLRYSHLPTENASGSSLRPPRTGVVQCIILVPESLESSALETLALEPPQPRGSQAVKFAPATSPPSLG